MRNAGLDELQAGLKIAGRNNQPQICRWYHPNSRKQRRTKGPLDGSERGEWKSWLKTQHLENKDHRIWSHHVMANRWGNNGNSEGLYFGELQNHCRWWLSHEIKRCLLLGRKAAIHLDSILKSRGIILLTKIHLVKTMVFLLVMCGCKSWIIKKAELRRIDALNCGVGEDSWESLGLRGDPTNQS